MIYSNERKLSLSGWLQQYNSKAYDVPLRLQKFLFFYESFSKTAGEEADFDRLRGYKRGPVFSNVWGDYTKDREEFNNASNEAFKRSGDYINQDRALKCSFIVSVLSERELSELSHQMNIWRSKEERITNGEYQVPLSEDDFNENDKQFISSLDIMFPNSMIRESFIIPFDDVYYVLSIDDIPKLTESHMDTLAIAACSKDEELHNPVYVSIDKGGRLIID